MGTSPSNIGATCSHVLLRREDLVVNAKRTYRLYKEEGLTVRTKKRRRLPGRERAPLALPERRNQRWSLDFVSDSLCSGRRFRVLYIVDDYSRESPGQLVDVSISGDRRARFLDRLADLHGLPEEIVMDNGPEMTSKAMFLWSLKTGVRLRETWRRYYNEERPHSALGYDTPSNFARRSAGLRSPTAPCVQQTVVSSDQSVLSTKTLTL